MIDWACCVSASVTCSPRFCTSSTASWSSIRWFRNWEVNVVV